MIQPFHHLAGEPPSRKRDGATGLPEPQAVRRGALRSGQVPLCEEDNSTPSAFAAPCGQSSGTEETINLSVHVISTPQHTKLPRTE